MGAPKQPTLSRRPNVFIEIYRPKHLRLLFWLRLLVDSAAEVSKDTYSYLESKMGRPKFSHCPSCGADRLHTSMQLKEKTKMFVLDMGEEITDLQLYSAVLDTNDVSYTLAETMLAIMLKLGWTYHRSGTIGGYFSKKHKS